MDGDPGAHVAKRLEFGPFVLFPERQSLMRNGVPVRLGTRALDLLTALIERPGELVSKHDLITRVWPTTHVDESNLKVTMTCLRKALAGEDGCDPYIATVIGRGYRFVAPIVVTSANGPADRGPAKAQGNILPAGTAHIFGRDAEIAGVGADLLQHRIVSIVGAGGIGKTTVALAVAEAAIDRMRDGVWLVDFAPFNDPALVPYAVASTIGLKTNSTDVLATLCDHLRDREMLLLFDNCEHVIETAADCVVRLAGSAKDVTILATSREPLCVKGERVRRLAGLGLPPRSTHLTAAEALAYPAIQLFVERARARLEAFQLDDRDAPLAAEIGCRLDGLALAIELAATRVDVFSIRTLLDQLDDWHGLLIERRGGPPRQRTLIATLDWSHNLLSTDEADMLNAVSVFAGSFTAEDASAVTCVSLMDATDKLLHLADRSLLAADRAPNMMTFRLLETTRAYCRDRLRGSDTAGTINRRHAEHICAALDRAASEWAHEEAPTWGSRHRPLLDELRVALTWAGSDVGDRTVMVLLTCAGTPLWNHFCRTDECCQATARAIAELPATGLVGSAAEMKLQTFLAATLMFTRGPIPSTIKAAERALEISTALGDIDFHLRIQWLLAGFEILTGRHVAARDRMLSFLSVAHERDHSAIRDGASLLALAEFYGGRLDSAHQRVSQYYQPDLAGLENVRMARFVFDSNTKCGVTIGMFQWVMGWPERAARNVETIVRQTLATGHDMTVITALAMSGVPVPLWRKDFDDARRGLDMLQILVERNDLGIWRPMVLYFRGALACTECEGSAEGIKLLKQAVVGLDAIQHNARKPLVLGTLAEALAKAGRLSEASAAVRRALDCAEQQGELWCVPELLRVEASVSIVEGNSAEAERLLGKSITLSSEMGALGWQLRAANGLAALWLDGGRPQCARAMLQAIYDRFTEGYDTGDLKMARRMLNTID